MKNLALISTNSGLAITLPSLIEQAGQQASTKFIEFFTAEIRNPHTRKAYVRNAVLFLAWCEERGLQLKQLSPVMVAAYIEELGQTRSVSTVKQSLATIKHLFDYLVIGQVIPYNPATAVRGPRQGTSTGKTPVLFEDDARDLIDSIDISSVVGLRDRALIGIMIYSFARVGAVVKMQVKDYYVQGRRAWFKLNEKGSKYREIPAHHRAAEFIEQYLLQAEIAADRTGFLFRSSGGRGRELTDKPMDPNDVLRMIKRRAKTAELPSEISCHTFRATGITNYLENGGNIDMAAEIAGHVSTKTTQVYNRSRDGITLSEIERIRI